MEHVGLKDLPQFTICGKLSELDVHSGRAILTADYDCQAMAMQSAKSRTRFSRMGALSTTLRLFYVPYVFWRRGRDSNPRYGFPYSGFQDRLFQPLTHLSG